jgi:hypothetical protein
LEPFWQTLAAYEKYRESQNYGKMYMQNASNLENIVE